MISTILKRTAIIHIALFPAIICTTKFASAEISASTVAYGSTHLSNGGYSDAPTPTVGSSSAASSSFGTSGDTQSSADAYINLTQDLWGQKKACTLELVQEQTPAPGTVHQRGL